MRFAATEDLSAHTTAGLDTETEAKRPQPQLIRSSHYRRRVIATAGRDTGVTQQKWRRIRQLHPHQSATTKTDAATLGSPQHKSAYATFANCGPFFGGCYSRT